MKHLEIFFSSNGKICSFFHTKQHFFFLDEKSSEIFIHFALRFLKSFFFHGKQPNTRKFLKIINLMKLNWKKNYTFGRAIKIRIDIVVMSTECLETELFSIYYLGLFWNNFNLKYFLNEITVFFLLISKRTFLHYFICSIY